jgi:hypothetical protein
MFLTIGRNIEDKMKKSLRSYFELYLEVTSLRQAQTDPSELGHTEAFFAEKQKSTRGEPGSQTCHEQGKPPLFGRGSWGTRVVHL